jgi:3-isopropylmalate/(R)-2-methylmalate dehydratase small subunit
MAEDGKKTRISGRALPVRGNDIDTDRIVPARFMTEITFARMGEYPFYDERFDGQGNPKAHAFNDPRYRGASILFVNRNFGCGSSREHAPQALYRFGIRAVVGESFAAIFAGNCVMMGLPAVTVSSAEIERFMGAAEAAPETTGLLDLEAKTFSYGGQVAPVDLPESHRKALLMGWWDSTTLLLQNLHKARQVAARLPYVTGF